MVNNIIEGISLGLNSVFGDNYTIYADSKLMQGLQTPCFFIALLSPSQEPKLKGRYFRRHPFDIHYFPKTHGDYVEMAAVAERLYGVLEYITTTTGDVLRGTELNYEIIDNVLHFRINYNLFVRQEPNHIPMETADISTAIQRKDH